MSAPVDVLAVIEREAMDRMAAGFPRQADALHEARAAVAELRDTAQTNATAVEEMVTLLERYRGASDFSHRLDAWIGQYAFAGEKGASALARIGGAP